jgi:hypothetical protein
MALPADALFRIANLVALPGWLLLALAPALGRHEALARRIAGRLLPLLFATAYVALVAAYWGPGGFGSLQQVQQLFAQPALLLAGWLHYLAFDLFVGAWIAERAQLQRWPHALRLVLLALTFLFGPAGLVAAALAQRALARHAVAAPA